jgi:hypothetical protein
MDGQTFQPPQKRKTLKIHNSVQSHLKDRNSKETQNSPEENLSQLQISALATMSTQSTTQSLLQMSLSSFMASHYFTVANFTKTLTLTPQDFLRLPAKAQRDHIAH